MLMITIRLNRDELKPQTGRYDLLAMGLDYTLRLEAAIAERFPRSCLDVETGDFTTSYSTEHEDELRQIAEAVYAATEWARFLMRDAG